MDKKHTAKEYTKPKPLSNEIASIEPHKAVLDVNHQVDVMARIIANMANKAGDFLALFGQ